MAVPADDALLRLADPAVLPDGRIRFTVERHDDASLTVSCPTADVGDIVSFLAVLAKHASEQQGLGEGPPQMPYWTRIPATGVGLLVEETQNQPLLVVNLSGFALAFEIPNGDLIRLADVFARTANTLAAPTDRKN